MCISIFGDLSVKFIASIRHWLEEGEGGEKDGDVRGVGDIVKEEKTEPEKFDFEQKEKGVKLVEKDQRRAVGVN